MRSPVILILTIYTASVSANYGWINTLQDDVNEYFNTGVANPNLKIAFDLLQAKSTNSRHQKSFGFEFFESLLPEEKAEIECTLCQNMVATIIGWVESGLSQAEITDRWVALCLESGTSERVCRADIESNIGMRLWILGARNATSRPLTPEVVCGFFHYHQNICPFDETDFIWELNLDFLGPKPTPEVPQLPPEGSPSIKVLQFTDVHVDPNYRPGYNAECGEPMCCRFDQGIPENSSAAAGYWGDYRDCDMPIHTFRNMLQHAAATNQDVSYVIFTGDIIDHAEWTSFDYNTDLIKTILDDFALYFPSVPVIPILGNHEAHPTNVFSDPRSTEIPAEISTTWLYELAADLWKLPQETRPDILAGGMFSIEITPGLEIIGINTMFCYSFNWWLLYNNVDPAGELIWLATRLLELEQQGKKVHILSHIPSGWKTCMHFWSSQYRRIIDRFENTVVAQFHGHTHNDHFKLYYDLEDPSRATSVAFDAGSGTPYQDVNPNYRTYTVDPVSFRVLDHETWNFNLTAANLGEGIDPPRWRPLYSFKQAYNVSSLFPSDLDQLVKTMAVDPQLQEQYFRYYVKEGDAELAEGCDVACLEEIVCDIVISVHRDTSKCQEIFPLSRTYSTKNLKHK